MSNCIVQESFSRPSLVTEIHEKTPFGEPYIAVNPQNSSEIIIAVMSTNEISRNNPYAYKVVLFASADSGKSWKRLNYPQLNNEFAKTDPWIVWGKNQVIYFSSMVFVRDDKNKRRLKIYLYKSYDKGETWSTPIEVFKNTNGLDHPVLVYNNNNKNPLAIFISGGYGSSSTQIASINEDLTATNILTHDQGNKFNNNLGSGALLDDDTFVFIQTRNLNELRSVSTTDSGNTFIETTITDKCIPYGFPMLALENSNKATNNRLYAVWSEKGSVGTQIFMSYSDNIGKKWSKKLQVSSSSETINLMPQIKVNNIGDVLVAWTGSKSEQRLDCYNINYALSEDHGMSFEQKSLTCEKYCASTNQNGAVVKKWKLGGDYFGIDSDSSGNFHISWADSKNEIYQIWYSKILK